MRKKIKKKRRAASKAKQSKKEGREDRFCREYVVDLNGTRAAIAAGYSKKTAYSAAHRLLRNVEVQAKIGELQKKQSDKLDLKAEKTLVELSRLAFSNIGDYLRIEKGGDVRIDLSKATREQLAALQEVRVYEYVEGRGKNTRRVKRVRIKLYDKTRNLELLGKHQNLFPTKVEIEGLEGLADLITERRKRLKSKT